ncbi:MAG TPA: hypothetical protein VL461_00525 [Dictyobacter sp.]|jgi:hypothetical protein|nr:hypothetical protein [Dictyobacter sp.]
MNATLYQTTCLKLDIYKDVKRVNDDKYLTEPMMSLACDVEIDEKTLHDSFEQAVDERLTMLHTPWSQLYQYRTTDDLTLSTREFALRQQTPRRTTPLTEPLQQLEAAENWQKRTIFFCLACMLLMSGFDLMGLLVIHMMH